ncbi:MAG: MmgE/PrpD family protein [Chloroflexi bacterium]|nr:MmgE/PrpD family protein [Chloroflexota bacterium]
MDPEAAFAKLIIEQTFDGLPTAAVEKAKTEILDTLGVTLAGSGAEGAEKVVALARDLGVKPEESSVIAYGIKVPATHAALANAFMARSVDYDDCHDLARLHAGGVVISAAFATAERKAEGPEERKRIGSGVSGREFITAVVLGVEVMSRLGLARQEDRWAGWAATVLYGCFGAAAASARLLGLSEEQVLNALGIAYGRAAGNQQSMREGVLTKNLDVGGAAQGGVFASLAAMRGLTGAHRCFTGDLGIFKLYHKGAYDPVKLTEGLGETFEISNLGFKPYPCCRFNHTFIDLAIALRQEHEIEPEDIEEVVCYIDQEPHLEFHPLEEKQNPITVTEAQFSVPYCVATALINGAVRLDDFRPSAIADPRALALARQVTPKLDTTLYRMKEIPPAVVEIRTKNGVYAGRTEHPYGDPNKPMAQEALVRKFFDCAAHARKRLSERDISKVMDMVGKLEELDDVAEVIRILS